MKLRYEVGERVRFRTSGITFYPGQTGIVDVVNRRMLTVYVYYGYVDCTAEDVQPEDAEYREVDDAEYYDDVEDAE